MGGMAEKPKTEGVSYSPGLEGVIAGESALCQVDEGEAGLRYCGYAVGDLAEHAAFEEVAYLLLFGKLPARKELDDFCELLRTQWPLPGSVEAFIGVVPPSAHPMDILRTGVSLLGMTDPDAADGSHEANLRKAVRLLAQIPVIIASSHRLAHAKRQVQPQPGLTFAENLLYLLTDHDPLDTHCAGPLQRRATGTPSNGYPAAQRVPRDAQAKAMARALDVSLILYAEHEFNASTFAARVAASTLTDLHAAVTAAIATLKGPLHGGANEAVAAMLLEIRSRDRAERWVRDALAQKRRIMGFGHRVLRHGDVRSTIIQRHAEVLSRACGDTHWYEIAIIVDRVMQQEKGLYPNLDFYTAVAYLLMGIPRDLYTPVFVCSRIVGWCAHVIEQQDHNRLIRPRALYTGPPPQPYVPLDRRT
ncbi:MAG: citrate synthase [Nitrospirae bacterium]|nr:citrate synthase [Nitrospirota bacterium]